jgi:Tol biopolymer transport system component
VVGDRKPVSYLKTQFSEANGHVSPDGRWMAYRSDQSGSNEIYVRPFPDPRGGKWQISNGGGTDPRWKGDGTELFYFSADDHLMAANVRLMPRDSWS